MGKQTAKLVARIAENLPDIDSKIMQRLIKNPKELQAALRKALCSIEFEVFKTLKLGTGLKTAGDFLRALNDGGFRIRDSGKEILVRPGFKVSRKEIEVDLVDISVIELGFRNGATLEEIHKRAIKLGFNLCPPEVGPQLRLQYKDQPEDEQLFIAMKPITGSDSGVYMFYVECEVGDSWLSGCGGGPAGFWRGGKRFVFLRRK